MGVLAAHDAPCGKLYRLIALHAHDDPIVRLRMQQHGRKRPAHTTVITKLRGSDATPWSTPALRWAVGGASHYGGAPSRGEAPRPLDVLVEWEGEDSDGDLWEESWVSVTYLSKDLRDEARQLEGELFGTRGAQAPSRRAARVV